MRFGKRKIFLHAESVADRDVWVNDLTFYAQKIYGNDQKKNDAVDLRNLRIVPIRKQFIEKKDSRTFPLILFSTFYYTILMLLCVLFSGLQ